MPILALSIKQPWAWLIAKGYKDIENRTWPAKVGGTPFRGRIFIHASKIVDHRGAIWLWDHKERLGIQEYVLEWTQICNSWKEPAIIGEVDLMGYFHSTDIGIPATKSPWFTGPYGFVLKNPLLYGKPIPCKGALRFFDPGITDIRRWEAINASNLPAPR